MFFRYDTWVKAVQGPAIPGAQVYVCAPQPANVAFAPPTPLASIFSDPGGLVPIVQPILTDGFGHADFYAAPGLYTLVIAYGGQIQQVYPDQNLGAFGAAGLLLEVNNTPNGSQSKLNLVAGSGIAIVDDGVGDVTISSMASSLSLETNGTPNGNQALLNLASGSGISLVDNGSGKVTITNTGSIDPNAPGNRFKDWSGWKASPNTASLNAFGTTPGSSGVSGTGSAATATDPSYLSLITSGSANTQAYIQGSNSGTLAVTTWGLLPYFETMLSLPSVANIRIWAGLTDTTGAGAEANLKSDNPSATNNGAMFRFSTSAGDTQWQAVVFQVGSGIQVVGTGVSVSANTGYKLAIRIVGSNIVFYIGNTQVASIALAFTTSQRANPMNSVDNVGLANAKTMNVAYQYWDTTP